MVLGMDPTTTAIVAIVVAALSEAIALSPLRANSIIQLVLQFLRLAFPKR
jgi:hypothetical protein